MRAIARPMIPTVFSKSSAPVDCNKACCVSVSSCSCVVCEVRSAARAWHRLRWISTSFCIASEIQEDRDPVKLVKSASAAMSVSVSFVHVADIFCFLLAASVFFLS